MNAFYGSILQYIIKNKKTYQIFQHGLCRVPRRLHPFSVRLVQSCPSERCCESSDPIWRASAETTKLRRRRSLDVLAPVTLMFPLVSFMNGKVSKQTQHQISYCMTVGLNDIKETNDDNWNLHTLLKRNCQYFCSHFIYIVQKLNLFNATRWCEQAIEGQKAIAFTFM